MAGHKLVVLYDVPTDPAHFRAYYESTHLPLAARLPGLRASRHSFDVKGMGGPAPFFCVFEAEFDSEADMVAAFRSPEGRAVAADVPNYATGAVRMLHYPLGD